MGGCCSSSSRKAQFQKRPAYYFYPPVSEEHEFLGSRDGIATVESSGLLIDLNLNMSIPDTYKSPPAPLPFDFVLGHSQSTNDDFKELSLNSEEKPYNIVLEDKICRIQSLPHPHFLKKIGSLKPCPLPVPDIDDNEDDDDSCPTCFEGYKVENPKVMTRCNHHFHLSCILEWKERSHTCPICDQEMIY